MKDIKGETPLDIATKNQCEQIIDMIKQTLPLKFDKKPAKKNS